MVDISHFPTDESYERGVSTATKVYQYITDGEVGKFSVIHEDTTQPLKIAVLDTKKVTIIFGFVFRALTFSLLHRSFCLTSVQKSMCG